MDILLSSQKNTEYYFSWEGPEEIPFTKAIRNTQMRGSQHHQEVEWQVSSAAQSQSHRAGPLISMGIMRSKVIKARWQFLIARSQKAAITTMTGKVREAARGA